MKQDHRVGSLNSCIDELQQQAYAQKLELQDAHHGFFEPRKEQSRLQEAQIRNMHEMGEMERAQEIRVDEFSLLS